MFDKYIIRIEYDAVIPIEEIIIKVRIHSILEEIIFSMIISFEKKPEVKGSPIRAALVRPKIVVVIGILIVFILIIRISWYEVSWIMIPAHMNIKDLKNAWMIIWKYAR